MQTVIRISRRLDSFLHEVAQNFEGFFKYSRVKLQNQKPIAVDVLFKAYPMVPLSCRSNLAGRYLHVVVGYKSSQKFRFGCRPVCIAGAIIAWAGISASTISGSI
jgi:hypothetical protein